MENNARKSAIYIRVSTSYQVDKDSLPMQKKDLIAYSELILGISDYVVFEDAGYSGKNTDRPGFQEMMGRIRQHEFSHLLVWKIDRISRNLLDFAQMYAELKRLRVTFVSKNEQFDTSTAMGEAMLKIILVFAELERNMTSERVTATMISRANSGIWNGGRVPYGYSYDKESGKFSICEPEAKVCRLIRDDYLDSRSLIHTSREMNKQGFRTRSGAEWRPATVGKIISSPFYTGVYRYNRYKGTEHRSVNPEDEWVIVPDHHPAIFTQEEHEKMAEIRSINERSIRKVGQAHMADNVHIFRGLVFCAECGSRMTCSTGRLRKDGFRYSVYSCPVARRSDRCSNHSINDTVLGGFLINYILNMLRAKRNFSSIGSSDQLQAWLLRGNEFAGIDHIERTGLNEFFYLLSRYRDDSSYRMMAPRHADTSVVPPEVIALHRERDKQERALKRLQSLYLYSQRAMSEKDFIIKKKEITSKIDEVNDKLGLLTANEEKNLSDEEFMRKASHLLISSYLKEKEYIYFPSLVLDTSPDVLQTYMSTILDSVFVKNGKIMRITFANGLRQIFVYK